MTDRPTPPTDQQRREARAALDRMAARWRSLPGCGCGQLAIDGTGTCAACRGADHAPQGAQQQLFTPAPAQLAGQLSF